MSKYGFSYNVAKAKSILAAAGYKDRNGDGYVENKDGSKIDLRIVCPNGWSDWMTAIQIIAASAKAVGIKITPSLPEYNTMVDDRGHARFDLLLGNDRQYSNTPWTYYQYMYQLPILDNQTTHQLRAVLEPEGVEPDEGPGQDPHEQHEGLSGRTMSALEKTFLQDLPQFRFGTTACGHVQHETLEELALGKRSPVTPTSWRNYWQMTSIDMLTHLRPA